MPQLRRILKMNCPHVKCLRTFQVQLPVVDEKAFFWLALRDFERQTINSRIGFPDAKKTRAKKSLKFTPQMKFPNSVFVQFEPLVVDGCEQYFPAAPRPREPRAIPEAPPTERK